MISPPRFLIFIFVFAIAATAWSQGPKELWAQRYGGPGHLNGFAKVALDPAGNVIVAATSGQDDGNASARYTAKYAARDGALLWQRRHRTPGAMYDWSNDVAVDGAGNVIVTGVTDFGYESSARDFYTAKYAALDGALLWEHRYNGSLNYYDEPSSVAVSANGDVIVTGYTWAVSGGYGTASYTAKYAAADGKLLWEHRGPDYSDATKVVLDSAGNAIITGNDFYTVKYASADGALIWEHSYDGPVGGSKVYSVAVDLVGNVGVTGYSVYYEDDYTGTSYTDIYTAKYAARDGSLLWQKRYHAPMSKLAYKTDSVGIDVATDSAGNVIVAGFADCTIFTAKYNAATGSALWKKRRIIPNGCGSVSEVTVDSAGNAIVAGAFADEVSRQWYTAKYASKNGELLWEKRYAVEPDGYASADSVTVGRDFVIVAGLIDGDIFTAKYQDGPTPKTIGAEVFSPNKARLSGVVNPNGFATETAFEYGTDPTLGAAETTTPSAIGNGCALVPVGVTLFTLRPETKYYYRAIGTGSGLTVRGEIMVFTTPRVPTQEPPVARPTPRPRLRR